MNDQPRRVSESHEPDSQTLGPSSARHALALFVVKASGRFPPT